MNSYALHDEIEELENKCDQIIKSISNIELTIKENGNFSEYLISELKNKKQEKYQELGRLHYLAKLKIAEYNNRVSRNYCSCGCTLYTYKEDDI